MRVGILHTKYCKLNCLSKLKKKLCNMNKSAVMQADDEHKHLES